MAEIQHIIRIPFPLGPISAPPGQPPAPEITHPSATRALLLHHIYRGQPYPSFLFSYVRPTPPSSPGFRQTPGCRPVHGIRYPLQSGIGNVAPFWQYAGRRQLRDQPCPPYPARVFRMSSSSSAQSAAHRYGRHSGCYYSERHEADHPPDILPVCGNSTRLHP